MENAYRLPESFATPRYLLRRVRPGDAQPVFDSYAQDPDVTRYLGWVPHESVADTAAFLHAAAAQWDQGTGFPLVAFDRTAPGKLIGMFHPHSGGHRVTYGYVLRKSVWGRGAASEILRALVAHALAHPAIFRAEAFCDVENRASARVMEKAGMTREGILRSYFRHPNIADTPRDCVLYSKTRQSFRR